MPVALNALLHPLKPDAHTRLLIADMAAALVESGTDLGSEEKCVLTLIDHRFRGADIDALFDDVVEVARALAAETARPEGAA